MLAGNIRACPQRKFFHVRAIRVAPAGRFCRFPSPCCTCQVSSRLSCVTRFQPSVCPVGRARGTGSEEGPPAGSAQRAAVGRQSRAARSSAARSSAQLLLFDHASSTTAMRGVGPLDWAARSQASEGVAVLFRARRARAGCGARPARWWAQRS